MVRFIWLILVAAFVSCAKEETASTNQNNIVGKWLRVEEYVNPGSGGNWIQTNDVPPVTVEFTAGGKIISNHPLYSNYTNYKTSGTDSIEITNPGNNSRFASYSLANGRLTLTTACRDGCGDRFARQ